MRNRSAKNYAALSCALFLGSCALFSKGAPAGGGLSPSVRKLVSNAVFEVVLEKPKDDPVVYEKELNWELVPYAIRSDNYYSIGTAFAVSPTELATAFHVINLGTESKVYTKYYVRDGAGGVFEVDKVTGGSSERDFLFFTVKGRTFSDYFTFKKELSVNEPVYSIGNALGEGIVVRAGMTLGVVPESESGRWNLLKSSADGNPGNSGGPLVTPRGQVVALVTSLRDNILYSTPASVLMDYQRENLVYRIKTTYEHLILTNTVNKTFEMEIPLPAAYKTAQRRIVDAYQKHYIEAMGDLFNGAPEYLSGPNNAYLLGATTSSIFPQLDYVDRNDNNWKLSRFDVKSINLDAGGRLLYAGISGFNFFKIARPKTTPLASLNTDPRFIMDMILRNWRTERTLWRGDKYRILSFGEPTERGEYRDSLGRTWITAYWVIGFDDRVMVMYILPLPGGPAVITTIQASGELFVYQWDIQKTCDHIHAAYSATFEEWGDFLALGKYRPDFLTQFTFNWTKEKSEIDFALPDFSVAAGPAVFPWTDLSELFLLPAHYKLRDSIQFGITKTVLNRNNRGDDYIVLVKNIKPDARLGPEYQDKWDDLLQEKFPFNGRSALSPKDNNGSIGVLLPARFSDDEIRWTLYMELENPTETELTEKLNQYRKGVTIVR